VFIFSFLLTVKFPSTRFVARYEVSKPEHGARSA
jgi:hypothetical protein